MHLQFFQNDTLGVGSTSERLMLEGGSEGAFLVSLVGPAVDAAFGTEFASSVKSSRLVLACKGRRLGGEDGKVG